MLSVSKNHRVQLGMQMTENFVKAASVKNECVEKEKMRLTHI